MPELISLLMPHFDYTRPVVKTEAKREPGRTAKVEPKKEQQRAAKLEPKQETRGPPLGFTKRELPAATKREQHPEVAAGIKRAKMEPFQVSREQIPKATVEEALRATALQITSFDRTSAVVCIEAPPGQLPLEAVASATNGAALRVPCAVDFREDRHGDLKPHAEARLVGLDPKHEYRIKLQISGAGETGCSHEAILPQRAQPSKWSSRDVTAWCQAQHVPELVRMAQEYAIDGKTLLSMGEEDLKASGVVAPFLLRRTLTGLANLRAAGS